jgi:hypothetical protein
MSAPPEKRASSRRRPASKADQVGGPSAAPDAAGAVLGPSDRRPVVLGIPSDWLVANARGNRKRLVGERALRGNSPERIMAIDAKITQLDSYISWSKRQPSRFTIVAVYIADDPIYKM